MTIYFCPRCGAPVTEAGDDVVPIPNNYKPSDYQQGLLCRHCHADIIHEQQIDDYIWYSRRMAEDDSY